jgi:hypothetical protein
MAIRQQQQNSQSIEKNGHNVSRLDSFQPYSRAQSRFLVEDNAVPAGYDLQNDGVELTDITTLRFHSSVISVPSPASICGVYFPLIATLIPKWISITQAHNSGSVKRLLVLVSGRGQPQDQQASHADN